MISGSVNSQIEKYGHYDVDGQLFLSKSEALIAAKHNYSKIKYYYNDHKFSKYDWTKEPEPDVGIEEFYKRRALQLRNKYDYLILMYSGGPDSTNILNTFVKNKIRIDEIVNVNSYSQTGVVQDTIHNADYVYNVKPILDQLVKDYNLKTKITIIDEIDLVKQHWKHHQTIGEYDSLVNAIPAPSMIMTKQIWVRYVPHLWKMVLDAKNVGIIIGADKAVLAIKDGKYCKYFNDIIGPDASYYNQNDKDLKHLNLLEYFYTGTDAVDLSIKQSHILKNYVEANRNQLLFTSPETIKQLITTKDQAPALVCESKHCRGNLNYNTFHKLIYPGTTLNVVTPKTTLLITRPADNWWIDKFDYNEKKIFLHGVCKFAQQLRLHDNVTMHGQVVDKLIPLPLIHSKYYFLE